MSKNTNIADLINYISVDGSGNVVLSTGQLVATQNYVTTAVSNLVASAPSTLDTLNELATALGNDANFATTVATSIGTKLNLSGGTLTGALNGTSASFSGLVTANGGVRTTGANGYSDTDGTSTIFVIANISGSVPAVAVTTNHPLAFYTNNTEKMRITSGGNVGIGQNNPLSPLSFANTTGNKIDFYNDGTARYSVQINGGELRFYTNQTNDIISLYAGNVLGLVNKNGSIGIGTISPQTPLQILKDTNTNGTNIEEANMAFSVLSAPGQSKIAIGACNAGNYGYIQVMQDATSWTNRNLTLQPRGGNVGIGTYNPSDKLHIVGSLRYGSDANNIVSFADGGGVYMEITGANSNQRQLRIQGINNAGNRYSSIRLEAGIEEIAFTTADAERMRISAPGDLYLYNGSIQQQGVWTVFNTGFTDGTSSFNFDIGVGDEGGGGNIFKVEAGFAHFSGMAYNCLAEFYISTRGTGSEITDIIRRDTSLAGSFTAWKTTSTVLRVNKSAGTYPGGGRYWIKVTKVNY